MDIFLLSKFASSLPWIGWLLISVPYFTIVNVYIKSFSRYLQFFWTSFDGCLPYASIFRTTASEDSCTLLSSTNSFHTEKFSAEMSYVSFDRLNQLSSGQDLHIKTQD